ncbi:MAG TPA: zf-HC2 domain-containing protein [Actinomycetota bacterium]|nr:zf-HC2 domain-containing protein [Actinomycetota bacterium]
MTCDEVRDQLAEHLLGTLDEVTDAGVRSHLRSCGGCRREMAAMAEGIVTFSRAAHEVEPPTELRDRVLGAVAEEWAETAETTSRRRPVRTWIASAAAAAAVVASLGWGMSQANVASNYERDATRYKTFLGALGGKAVRVGTVRSTGTEDVTGSAVLYDSDVQQSWVLILVRAPGMTGEANVELSSDGGRTIDMHPLEFSAGGEASSWLVTSSNLEPFNGVTITDTAGNVIATAAVQRR